MPVSEQCTGPVAIWVSVDVTTVIIPPTITVDGGSINQSQFTSPDLQTAVTRAPVFFGWGESAPEQEFVPEYENIMSDLRGSRKAHDRMYEGSDGRVNVTMTLWDEQVLDAMMAITKDAPVGVDSGTSIGTIMHAEKKSFFLWLVYVYRQVKTFMQTANMKAGYRYLGAMLDGPVRRATGTKVNKIALSWFCGAQLVGLNNGLASYACYDQDMSAVIGKPTVINRT